MSSEAIPDPVPVVGIRNVVTVPCQEKIDPMNSSACDVERIISSFLWHHAVVKQFLGDFDDRFADY